MTVRTFRTEFASRAATAIAASCLVLGAAAVQATPVTFVTEINGDNARPDPVISDGTGTGYFIFDSENDNVFTWSIEFSDLSGPATAAHIHAQDPGTTPGDVTGGIIIDFSAPDEGAIIALGDNNGSGTLFGFTNLDAEQVVSLESDLWYVNIHTEDNPTGEIRGQIETGGVVPATDPIPLPAAAWLMLWELGVLGLKRRKA